MNAYDLGHAAGESLSNENATAFAAFILIFIVSLPFMILRLLAFVTKVIAIIFTFIFVVMLARHPVLGLLIICGLCYYLYYSLSSIVL